MRNLLLLLIGLSIFSCEKVNYLPLLQDLSDNNKIELIKGTWVEQKFPQNNIIITDSTITQVGFPLVTGDDIRHKTLRCTYQSVIKSQPRDSFELNVLSLHGDVLNLEIDNYFGTRDKVFTRIK